MTTKLFGVAKSSIAFVSSNSTKKVDLFSKIRSDAPILVKIRSTGDIWQEEACTKQPIYAIMTVRHVYLSIVDFPPILGPVISRQSCSSIVTSFATKFFTGKGFFIPFISNLFP